MVETSMMLDEFGGLLCTLTDGKAAATVHASNPGDATSDLLAALDDVIKDGAGECFWARESGMYRWLFRLTGQNARVVVLWSSGTMTGWENVFWADCEWAPLEAGLRKQAGALRVVATACPS